MARRSRGRVHPVHELIRTMVIHGEKFEIYVNSDGEFTCRTGLDYVKADRLADVIPLVRKAARKLRVEVAIDAFVMGDRRRIEKSSTYRRFQHYGEADCYPVTIIGINPDTNEIRYRYADGKRSSAVVEKTRYNSEDFEFAKKLTDSEVQTWRKLYKDRKRANEAFDTFTEKHRWQTVFADVKEAIAAAVDDPKETDDGLTGDPREDP